MSFEFYNDIEELKGDIFRSFSYASYEECIGLCDNLIQKCKNEDGITYQIYGYTFKGLSIDALEENNQDAIACFLLVDKFTGIEKIVIDDLWVYFFVSLAKSKLGYYKIKNYEFEDIYSVAKQGFDFSPAGSDIENDISYRIRLGIIKKFANIIQLAFNPFRLKFRFITNKEGKILNMGLTNEDDQLIAVFGNENFD